MIQYEVVFVLMAKSIRNVIPMINKGHEIQKKAGAIW